MPDKTAAELAARAALTGRSLQEHVRARLVEMADTPDAEVWLARVREHEGAAGPSMSARRLLDHHEAGRR